MVKDRWLSRRLRGYLFESHFRHPEVNTFSRMKHIKTETDGPLLTSSVLEKAGFVKSPDGGFQVSQFVTSNIVTLT